ncbi:hypothetical protein ACFL1Q_01130 [Patescibacteria group bacterium]
MRKGLIILLILLVIWLFVRFVIGGSEDDWICVEGKWIKHGQPTALMPEEECDN